MRQKYLIVQLKALLDMARKYMADRLLKIAINHLRELFPSDYSRAQASYSTLRTATEGAGEFDPWVAVEISLDHNVPIILPTALYYSALGKELEEILDFSISFPALRKILLFREAFIAEVNTFSAIGEGYFDASECPRRIAGCCGQDASIQEEAIRHYRNFEDDIFQKTHVEADLLDSYDSACEGCLKEVTNMQREFSEHLWDELPTMTHCASMHTWAAFRDAQAKADGVSVSESVST